MSLVPLRLTKGRKKKILEELLRKPFSEDAAVHADAIFKNIKFEQGAPYDGKDKKLFTYDASLAALRKRKFQRHPYPAEVMSFLIAYYEKKLPQHLAVVAEDMLASYGEWFNLATKRQGDTLLCYEDPKNLIWNERKGLYVPKGKLQYERLQKFSIPGLPSSETVELQNVDPQLQRYFYSREWKDLPSEMKTDSTIWLPEDGQLWPVGRGIFNVRFIVICYDYNFRASRGVVPSRAKK